MKNTYRLNQLKPRSELPPEIADRLIKMAENTDKHVLAC